jgi:hypothetical protein
MKHKGKASSPSGRRHRAHVAAALRAHRRTQKSATAIRVRRKSATPHRCPHCGRVRSLSRGQVWPWTRLRCSSCDIWWWYGTLRR